MNMRFLNLNNMKTSAFNMLWTRKNILDVHFPRQRFRTYDNAVCIHTSLSKLGLMEFFDEKQNWSKNEIRVGRAWKKEELRIKNNEDLHKLWFVLLKERNMLLTMEHEYNANVESLPSPERIDKVKESMVNLEEVVRERNRAYYLLETGETGERPGRVAHNSLGMRIFYKSAEHVLPQEMNRRWFVTRQLWYNRKEVKNFILYLREKIFLEKRRERIREREHVLQLLKRFPDVNVEALKQEYPHLDVNRLREWKKARGHWVPT